MTRVLVALLLAVAALAPSAAVSHSHKKKGLEIVHPWTPAMLEAEIVNIPVYMTLKNGNKTDDRLLSAATALAKAVELIEPKGDGAIKLPMQVAVLRIAARDNLELKPDGPHLLLLGVTKQLHAYDSFKLTLVFEKAGRIVVEVVVEEMGALEPHKH